MSIDLMHFFDKFCVRIFVPHSLKNTKILARRFARIFCVFENCRVWSDFYSAVPATGTPMNFAAYGPS